jgi:hypothetical protein
MKQYNLKALLAACLFIIVSTAFTRPAEINNLMIGDIFSDIEAKFKQTEDFKQIMSQYEIADNSIHAEKIKNSEDYLIIIDLVKDDLIITKSFSYFSKKNNSFKTLILKATSNISFAKINEKNIGLGEAVIMNVKGEIVKKFITNGNKLLEDTQSANKILVSTPEQRCVASKIADMSWVEYGLFLATCPTSMIALYVFCIEEVN